MYKILANKDTEEYLNRAKITIRIDEDIEFVDGVMVRELELNWETLTKTIIVFHKDLPSTPIGSYISPHSVKLAKEQLPFLFKVEEPEEPKLRPCPMCKSDSLYYPIKGVMGIKLKCNNCGLATGWYPSIEDLFKAWNGMLRYGDK